MIDLCHISLCPPDVSTDIEYVIESPIEFENNPNGFIIEFGMENPDINVS